MSLLEVKMKAIDEMWRKWADGFVWFVYVLIKFSLADLMFDNGLNS
jgi:hypothetical protein